MVGTRDSARTQSRNSIQTYPDAQGVRHVLVRSAIDELTSTGRSLMPEGLDKLFERPTDVRDLIAYVQSLSAATKPRSENED